MYLFIFFYLLGPIKTACLKFRFALVRLGRSFFLLEDNFILKRDIFGAILHQSNCKYASM